MNIKLLFLALIITLLIAPSCIKELNLPFIEVPVQVVVNSLFSPDSILQVHVGLSNPKPVNQSKLVSEPNFEENATVLIYKDGVFLEQLPHTENGWYASSHLPEEGAKYKIEVLVDEFELVWAESSVPRYPEMTQPAECRLVGPMIIYGEQYVVRDTYIHFNDLAGEDFYGFYLANSFRIDSFSNALQFNRVTDQSLLSDLDIDIVSNLFVFDLSFTDRLFEGQNKTLHLPGVSYGSEIPEGYEVGFGQRFGSVSKEFYNYFKILYRHLYNSNSTTHIESEYSSTPIKDPIALLFMGAPVQAYTNINGGLGVFAGYNYKVVEVFYVD